PALSAPWRGAIAGTAAGDANDQRHDAASDATLTTLLAAVCHDDSRRDPRFVDAWAASADGPRLRNQHHRSDPARPYLCRSAVRPDPRPPCRWPDTAGVWRNL